MNQLMLLDGMIVFSVFLRGPPAVPCRRIRQNTSNVDEIPVNSGMDRRAAVECAEALSFYPGSLSYPTFRVDMITALPPINRSTSYIGDWIERRV